MDTCPARRDLVGVPDFGLGYLMDRPDMKLKTFCGTLEYAAPEMVGKRGYDCAPMPPAGYPAPVNAHSHVTRMLLASLPFRPYSGPATDVWSLAAMLYVMLTGDFPFVGDDPADVLRQMDQGGAAVRFPNYVPSGASECGPPRFICNKLTSFAWKRMCGAPLQAPLT